MQLIPNATQAWKFLSVQVIALVGIFDMVHQNLPMLQAYIPVAWLGYINAAGAVVAVVARLVQQESLNTGAPDFPCAPAPVGAAASAPLPATSEKGTP